MIILLKEKIKSLSKKPGVYVFKNSSGQIIYIGKALSLKHRVSSYFQNKQKDPKTQELVANIADLQTIIVNSEFEALLLEAKLIKQHKPKYNIQAKDGKSYLYIVIGKEFPNRIYSSRNPELEENLLDWFGPFPSRSEVKEILKFIRRILPFRSCAKLPKSPCLYHHLKLCSGVCVRKDDRMTGNNEQSKVENYKKTIQNIKKILSGKTKFLLKDLEKEISSATKALDFEKASAIKYKIDTLNRLTSGWKSVPKEYQEYSKAQEGIRNILIKFGGVNQTIINKIEGFDVSNLGKDIIVGSMVVFIEGQSDNSQYRKFNLKAEYTLVPLYRQNDPEGIKQILTRRLNHSEWLYPQLILVDGGKTQIGAAFEAIKEKNLQNQITVLGLTKEEETIVIPHIKDRQISSWKLLRLSRSSPELKLLQVVRDESHRFAQNYYKSLHSKIIFD